MGFTSQSFAALRTFVTISSSQMPSQMRAAEMNLMNLVVIVDDDDDVDDDDGGADNDGSSQMPSQMRAAEMNLVEHDDLNLLMLVEMMMRKMW